MEREPTDRNADSPRFRHALVWLLVPVSTATLLYIGAGRLGPPEHRGDTSTYLRIAEHGIFTKQALESTRTLGYPAFLKVVDSLFGSLAPIPVLHWAAFCASIIFLAFALFRVGGSVPLCVALTSPLFFSDIAAGYLPVVLTEVPATALAIAAIAALILAALEPDRRRWWVVLAVMVFLSYQFRPAFLFLIGIVPVLSILIHSRVSGTDSRNPIRWKVALKATAAVGVPFGGYCLLRLFLVGHFGLVSFAGTNIVGITGSILQHEMLAELSADVRPLAARMLEIRSSSKLDALQKEKHATWANAVNRKAGLIIPSYETIERLYNDTIRQVALPAAREIYGSDRVAIDRAFSQLSLEVVSLCPVAYIAWIGLALYRAFVTGLTLYLMLGLWALLTGIFVVYRLLDLTRLRRKLIPRQQFALLEHERRVFGIMAIVALVFFCAKSLLVAAVEPTIPRYVRPAAIFLSMLPAMVIYCQVRHGTSAIRSRKSGVRESSRAGQLKPRPDSSAASLAG